MKLLMPFPGNKILENVINYKIRNITYEDFIPLFPRTSMPNSNDPIRPRWWATEHWFRNVLNLINNKKR